MVDAANEILVEKYRPETLDEVRGNERVVSRIKKWVNDDTMPNLLLYGPRGSGKTSIAVSFVKDKFGEDWQNHFLQLNASDDRGINVVREQVKSFARLSTVSEHPWKVIFLDEADSLSNSAQPALRRVMEDYSDRTRFILSCNYPNQIIDPIQSRCVPFSVDRLDGVQLFELLKEISEDEGYEYVDDQLEELISVADGDARRSIHLLQAAVVDGEVDDETISAFTVPAQREDVDEIVSAALVGDQEEAMGLLGEVLSSGINEQELCDLFLSVIKTRDDIPADSKVKMIDKVAECEWRMLNGSKPHIQFDALIANLRVARFLSLAPYRSELEGSE